MKGDTVDSVLHLVTVVVDFVNSPVGLVWVLTLAWAGLFFLWRSRRNLEEAILMEARARGLSTDVQKMQIRRVNALIVAVWMIVIYLCLQATRLVLYYASGVSVDTSSGALLSTLGMIPLTLWIAAIMYFSIFTRSLPNVCAGRGKDRIVRLMV